MRALVIDDSPTMRLVLRRALSELGFGVLEAEDGREALDRLGGGKRIDLALVDWNMAEMDGLAFVKAVRAGGADVPVLMVTSEQDSQRMREALEQGADEYLMKPFTKEMLAGKLRLLHLLA